MNEKETGSFYTPEKLIEFMVSYIGDRVAPSSILEPSAGDGRFIKHIEQLNNDITLVEFDVEKANHLKEKYNSKYKVICSDFISYSLQEKTKFDLIIGNPPYIAKKAIPQDQYNKSLEIANYFNLDKSIVQNLWVSFVLSSIKMLENNGSIFFVLPFEFLQVQYAEKLRNFLEIKFNTIEIVTFEERIFEDIEQDVCLVYLTNETMGKPYIKYCTYKNANVEEKTFESVIMRNKPLKKWSNCILNDEETERLMNLARKYKKIAAYGEISPGIVTGANSFFIIPQNKAETLQVPPSNILKIITKSSVIPWLLCFKKQDFDGLCGEKNNTHMLSLVGLDKELFSKELREYIKKGEKEEINVRYKCSHRNRWYDVPVVKSGEACFFKRYHHIPRVVLNQEQIHTTDIIYNIRFYPDYDPASFVFCFYNSLTLALCEYNGRFYGGGVGELVPSEFKSIALPYKKIRKQSVEKLDRLFRNKADIDEIIDYVDSIVLSDFRQQEILLLQNIRKRYLDRRLKNLQK